MIETPFSDLVKDAANELAGKGAYRTAELLKRITSEECEQEQAQARRRHELETSIDAQLELCNKLRAAVGKPELSRSEFLAQDGEGDDNMALINEDRLGSEIMRRFKGRIVLACAAAIGVGVVIGAVLF